MEFAPLADLDSLDRDALLALVLSNQEKITARDEELCSLLAELDTHRERLSEQADELRSRSEHIEHLKLMVDKLRHMLFGTKSEKVALKLEQFELELEEMETTQAEAESALEQVAPVHEPKVRVERKPLPEHLPREVVTHAPGRECCPDCGSQLRQFGEDISEQLEYVPENFKPGSPRMGLRPWGGRLSATYGLSSPAPAVIASCRCQLHRALSSADLPGLGCSRT